METAEKLFPKYLRSRATLGFFAIGGHESARALTWLATMAFLHAPNNVKATNDFVRNYTDFHFHCSPGMPDVNHAASRTLLAGTMGVTNLLVAHRALVAFRGSKKPPIFGANASCYSMPGPEGGEPKVQVYSDPVLDRHMRSTVQLTDAAQYIHRQSQYTNSLYSQYAPLWEFEMSIRQTMPDVPHVRNTQHPFDNHPLDSAVVGPANAQFARNVMHYLMMVKDSVQPDASTRDMQIAALERISALEAAARHPRETQRACMGIRGTPYDSIRQSKLKGDQPHLAKVGDDWRVAGLENDPPHSSMCSGQDRHELPEWIQEDVGISQASPIGMLALWATEIAPYTLFCNDVEDAW